MTFNFLKSYSARPELEEKFESYNKKLFSVTYLKIFFFHLRLSGIFCVSNLELRQNVKDYLFLEFCGVPVI